MRVYLIAPLPSFGSDAVLADYLLPLDEPYALIAAAGIATVAAFFDETFSLRLCDEIIEAVDFEDPSEVICISMNVSQAVRGIQIARRFRAMGRTVIMGGAHVSLAPEMFDGEADCLVIGEFEPIATTVINDLRAGTLLPRYQGAKADLATSPKPRWDLYRNDRAISGVVQTSRGCPFECNFCDVIQYLGRVQRHKPPECVIAELQQLYELGYRSVNMSDDNFTVYRQRTRTLLQALIAWNGQDGREPMQFSTQMSIDIARDEDLLGMCNQAGMRTAFVGIETSSEEALKESLKRQNLRQDLTAQCSRIVAAGITVQSGMMLGFDSDDLSCFERQFRFAMSLPVVHLKVAVLVAPVATPLYDQLKAAGRLLDDPGQDPSSVGNYWTNIMPRNMTRAQLAEGATWLVDALMEPDNVIRRFESYAAILKPAPELLRRPARRTYGTSGASPMLQLIQKGAKDPGGRKVIDAVDVLAKARPEIANDLLGALAMHLSNHILIAQQKRTRNQTAQNPANQIIALLK
ncbi:MAG: radical SAM protein [Pseudomonadota bacterium]